MKARTRTMIILAAFAGLRVHEIAKMHSDDCDLLADELRVVGKGKIEAWLPMHERIREEALQRVGIGWWFPSAGNAAGTPHVLGNSVSGMLSAVMERAEVPGTPHSLRHYFATTLLKRGVDVRVVQELMRHQNLNTTAGYTLVDDEQRRSAIAAL